MRRREFIALLGGAATAWPGMARGQQQGKRMRRVGALMAYAANDPQVQIRNAAFLQGLQALSRVWRSQAATSPVSPPGEYGIGAKWLEVLKQVAPSVTRAAVLRDRAITAGIGLWGAIQSVSPAFGVELRPIDVRDAGEIERAVSSFARSPNGGLILTGSALA